MSNFQLPDPNRDQNPGYVFDRITGSTIKRDDGYHVVIRKWHSGSGAERFEESTMRWMTEGAAEAAAEKVLHEMRQRIIETEGQ